MRACIQSRCNVGKHVTDVTVKLKIDLTFLDILHGASENLTLLTLFITNHVDVQYTIVLQNLIEIFVLEGRIAKQRAFN